MANRAATTEQTKSDVTKVREKLLAIVEVREAEEWLITPKRFLGGRTPLQAIEDGEADRLIRRIGLLEHGIPL